MAFVSLKDFLSQVGLGTPAQFDEWTKAWKVAVESGSQETLLGFLCRERGLGSLHARTHLAGRLAQLSGPLALVAGTVDQCANRVARD